METPNTRAGKLTEEVMAKIAATVKLETEQYNAVYSAVLDALSRELKHQSVKRWASKR